MSFIKIQDQTFFIMLKVKNIQHDQIEVFFDGITLGHLHCEKKGSQDVTDQTLSGLK
jgi:hypothetical protein